ncbi:hypothetical protein [Rufibacter latericius]|uniref:Uncharacterized protein n=1 Tax=Rufibacter latericius TaxID=2487040 RepID=A0A3M9MNU3_9BACT|nr:hypothetical protein [Rufibacter latericius]RNI26865.1 hypothetical protein EFB08_10325 [Rufibacter latericius]
MCLAAPSSLRWVLFLLLSFVSHLSFAQEPPVKYGVVSEEEVKMQVYAKDTSAAVVVLADYGYLRFPNPLS